MQTARHADRRHVLQWLGSAVGTTLADCTVQFGGSETKDCGLPVSLPDQPGSYANQPTGYDIRYPDNWDPGSSGDPSHFVALGPPAPSASPQPFRRRLTVKTHYYDTPVSVETLATIYRRNARRIFGPTAVGFEVLNQQAITIASGQSGRLFDTRQGNPGSDATTPIRRRTLLVPLDGSRYVYCVSVSTHETDYRAFLPTSQRILDPFTLTERPVYRAPSVDDLTSFSTEGSEYRFSVEYPSVWCAAYHPDFQTLFVDVHLQYGVFSSHYCVFLHKRTPGSEFGSSQRVRALG